MANKLLFCMQITIFVSLPQNKNSVSALKAILINNIE